MYQPAGLYIHIPFCLNKCPYCDFYSVTDPALHQIFLDVLRCEMHLRAPFALAFDTLYIGGGTPSILSVGDIDGIIDTAHRTFSIYKDIELTVEVNPGTITPEKLKAYRHVGINRLNIGVQSFSPANLELLGRIHTAEDAKMALRWAHAAGFENVGIDLIYGIAGQTRKSWIKELQRALEFEPEHLSCYMLTYEPGTLMNHSRRRGRLHPLPDGKISALFETTLEFLDSRNYVQYEISSFAKGCSGKAGFRSLGQNRSRHNRKYWSFAPYLGLGPSAHSFKETERSWNRPDVRRNVEEVKAGRCPPAEREVLSRSQLIMEAVYLGLRQTEGITIDAFEEKFALSFQSHFGGTLKELDKKGLVRCAHNHCALTRKGMLFLDGITSMMVDNIQ